MVLVYNFTFYDILWNQESNLNEWWNVRHIQLLNNMESLYIALDFSILWVSGQVDNPNKVRCFFKVFWPLFQHHLFLWFWRKCVCITSGTWWCLISTGSKLVAKELLVNDYLQISIWISTIKGRFELYISEQSPPNMETLMLGRQQTS